MCTPLAVALMLAYAAPEPPLPVLAFQSVAELPAWLEPAQWPALRPPAAQPIVPANTCRDGFEPSATGRCVRDCRAVCKRIQVVEAQQRFYGPRGESRGTAVPQGRARFAITTRRGGRSARARPIRQARPAIGGRVDDRSAARAARPGRRSRRARYRFDTRYRIVTKGNYYRRGTDPPFLAPYPVPIGPRRVSIYIANRTEAEHPSCNYARSEKRSHLWLSSPVTLENTNRFCRLLKVTRIRPSPRPAH
jgi:hypothetical protein